jgi:hypothetical protein
MSESAREKYSFSLRSIDLLARAVFTWVRQEAMESRFRGVPLSAEEQDRLAAGFIAGLRARLALRESEAELVAYAYALMIGERSGAAALAALLIDCDSELRFSCAGYLRGSHAARTLLCDLESIDNGRVAGSSPDESAAIVPITRLN